MPDFIDQLQDNNAHEIQLEHNLKVIREAAQAAPLLARKFCLNCNEQTQGGAAFCDLDCQEDYEKIQRMRSLKR